MKAKTENLFTRLAKWIRRVFNPEQQARRNHTFKDPYKKQCAEITLIVKNNWEGGK